MTELHLRQSREDWEKQTLSELATKSTDYMAKRWKSEPEDPYRTSFQRDIGRVMYSNAFRRLRMKTQVFTDPDDQHNRTRLTHSIEVSHIGRQISRALRLNEDLTEAIALGHDLGHTPFGHAGEKALNDMLINKGGFSHNAQSVWIVERCLHGRKIDEEYIPGLNLTYAVREGILKHTDVTTNLEDYSMFRLNEPATLEGQVVDMADGLAYLYHDIEDGVRNGIISNDEVIELWKQETGLEEIKWFAVLISDVIQNSYDSESIGFSESMETAYKALKRLVKEKVILSTVVQEQDTLGYEQVCEMFNLLYAHENLLPKNSENDYKMAKYGSERVIVDFIQWLGDQNFERVLLSYKNKI